MGEVGGGGGEKENQLQRMSAFHCRERDRHLTNRMGFSVICTLIDNNIRHHSGNLQMY